MSSTDDEMSSSSGSDSSSDLSHSKLSIVKDEDKPMYLLIQERNQRKDEEALSSKYVGRKRDRSSNTRSSSLNKSSDGERIIGGSTVADWSTFGDRECVEENSGDIVKKQRKIIEFQSNSNCLRKKRSSKHVPAEMSSKRPPKKYRDILETSGMNTKASYKPHDPRFSDLNGRFSSSHFLNNYKFLDDQQEQELRVLGNVLKKGKVKSTSKAEALKEQYTQGKQEMTERRRVMRALEKGKEIRAAEREKVKAGKRPFFLKKSTMKDVMLEDKFEQLKKEGKLRKFMEKKRKSNASKDRRWIPDVKE